MWGKEFKTCLLPLIWRRWPWGWRGWSSGSTWWRWSPWSCTCWSGSSGETWWRGICDNGKINIEDQRMTSRLSDLLRTFVFIHCLFSNGVKVPVHCYCRQCKYTGVNTQILKHKFYKQYIFSEGRRKDFWYCSEFYIELILKNICSFIVSMKEISFLLQKLQWSKYN